MLLVFKILYLVSASGMKTAKADVGLIVKPYYRNSFGERGMVDRDSMDDDEKDKMMDEDELDAEVVTDNNEVAVNVSKSTNYEYYKLPEPTLNNMKSIIETLDDVRYSRDKDRFAEYIMDEVIEIIYKVYHLFIFNNDRITLKN